MKFIISSIMLALAAPAAMATRIKRTTRASPEGAAPAPEQRKLGSCNFQCPANSSRKPNRHCYDNFFDCDCDPGYYKSGYQCVPFKDNACDYQCPENSFRKPNRQCYDTFDDCYCRDGYYKEGGKCIKEEYFITLKVTNLSFQQPFGGFFVATHNEKTPPLFTFGDAASPELALLAEDGNPSPLVHKYEKLPGVGEAFAFTEDAPYFGGETVEIYIPYDPAYPYVTVASMAINTNDCFISINGLPLEVGDVFTGVGYDAGSEENNERCDSIPGPACAAIDTRNNADGNGEGFVHVHRGFFGIGPDGLSASGYDWRNPMVRWEVL